jgi:hypothetical protein
MYHRTHYGTCAPGICVTPVYLHCVIKSYLSHWYNRPVPDWQSISLEIELREELEESSEQLLCKNKSYCMVQTVIYKYIYTVNSKPLYKILQNCKPNHLCIKMLIRWKDLDLVQSLKWKFEFTGPNQIFEFIFYIVLNKKQKNLVAQTKFYWSEAIRIVLIIS